MWAVLLLVALLALPPAAAQLKRPVVLSSDQRQVTVYGTTYTVAQATQKGNQLGFNNTAYIDFLQTVPNGYNVIIPEDPLYNCVATGWCTIPTLSTGSTFHLSHTYFGSAALPGYINDADSIQGVVFAQTWPSSGQEVAGQGGLLSTCATDMDCTTDSKPFCRTITDIPIVVYWDNDYLQAVYTTLTPSSTPYTFIPFVKGCVAYADAQGSGNLPWGCPNYHQLVKWTSYTSDMQHLYQSSDCQLIPSKPNPYIPPECVDDFQCYDKPGTTCMANPAMDCTQYTTAADGGKCRYLMNTENQFDITWQYLGGQQTGNAPNSNGTWRASCQCATGTTSNTGGFHVVSQTLSGTAPVPITAVGVAPSQQTSSDTYGLWYATSVLQSTQYNTYMTTAPLSVHETAWRRSYFRQLQLANFQSKGSGLTADACPIGYTCQIGPWDSVYTFIGSFTHQLETQPLANFHPSLCLGTGTEACQYLGFPSPNTATGLDWSCSCSGGSIPNFLGASQNVPVTLSNHWSGTQGCTDNCEVSVCNSNGLCTYGIDTYPGWSSNLLGSGVSQRTSPCDCNRGWTGTVCNIPDYNSMCCNGQGLYGDTSNPNAFTIHGKQCPYGVPINQTHPALCYDGSRPTVNVTCHALNDDPAHPSTHCACYAGYYGPRCEMTQAQCDAKVCMGHGHCVTDGLSNQIQCVCKSGWMTYPPYVPGIGYRWYFGTDPNYVGNNYQCQYPAPSALIDKATGLPVPSTATVITQTSTQIIVTIPRQFVCGAYGSPIDTSDGTPIVWFQGQYVPANNLLGSAWNQGQNFNGYVTPTGSTAFNGACGCFYDVGSQDPATSYCIKQASTWTAIASNDTTGNTAGLLQPCGAPYRGQVISLGDQYGSTDCYCYNGFGGTDCGVLQCPANQYGDPCSGPGLLNMSTTPATVVGRGWCDSTTGHCLCSTSTVGHACEIDIKLCSSNAAVYPYSGQVIA